MLYGDKFRSLMWVTDATEAAEHHAPPLSKLKMSKTRTFYWLLLRLMDQDADSLENVLSALIA